MAILTKTFNGAQVFYVDPASVGGEKTTDISSINLYFKFKPDTNLNLNNMPDAGVSVFIAETMFGTPRITRDSGVFTGEIARLSASEIITSSDASAPSVFRFPKPVTVETDKEYCFVLTFDLLSQFVLWQSVQGEVLTGSTAISPGPSSQFIGQFYDFNNTFVASENTNLDEYLKNWRPKQDASLKFDVNIARYSHGGVPVYTNASIANDDIIRVSPSSSTNAGAAGINFNVNFGSYEYISFDENTSTKSAFIGGMMCFQNTVSYPGGSDALAITINQGNNIITANANLPNGDPFQWSNIFPATNEENRVVLTDGTNYNVRRVLAIQSNTVVRLDEPVTFSNAAAEMMITPVGRVSSFNKSSPFGVEEAFLMLGNSSANSTVRFVNNAIESVSITGGGSGYSNDEVIYVTGYEDVTNKVRGGYNAVGNVTTNSTGGITSIAWSNLGCGFVNTNAILLQVANSSSAVGAGNTSNGSGLALDYTIGATLRTEYGGSIFKNCVVRNLDIGEFIPYSNIEIPSGTDYTLQLETNYIKKADSSVLDGDVHYVNPNASNNQLAIVMYDINSTESLGDTPSAPSKSNEFHIVYEDGSPNDKLATSNAANRSSESIRIITDVTANNDYSTVRLSRPSIQFSKYVINNDATDEHTDSGNAYAKGITKTIDFDRTAEDIRLFLTAYKPANTDIKVYARIYKNEDPEAFDDKNWTELELKNGIGLQSSAADPLDYVELEYGFYQVPQTRTALDGTVEITSGDATVTGSGTDFSTDLAAGDLVYLYQPLFVENHMVVAVESVTNATSFEMDTTTANASLLAEGMLIEKITYPEQAFNNKQNDNLVRYYNGSTSKFDGYETLAVKMVFLSDSPHRIPRIDDLRGTGVSA